MATRIRQITDREKLFIGQKKMLLRHLEIYPSGILSEVMDTYDLWQVLTEILPDPEVKAAVLRRDGKLVIRPDSGDPVDIICGHKEWMIEGGKYYTLNNRFMKDYPIENKDIPACKGVIELLWDVFGGKVNELGYKELDSHIGAIYGDSITLERAKEICERLKAKGFASTNIVFGVGSYTYQMNTRDTFGFAVKATYGEIRHLESHGDDHGHPEYVVTRREIFKDPITDDGTKKSKKGLLSVYYHDKASGFGDKLYVCDQQTWEEEETGELKVVFEDGRLMEMQSLESIRKRIKEG
jgi:nicotinamide phosphoribosyltransferase